MKKLLVALLLTLPTMAVALDLEGFYITPKGGVSKSMDTGVMNYTNSGTTNYLEEKIYIFMELVMFLVYQLTSGKFVTDNLRFEIEATKRTSSMNTM